MEETISAIEEIEMKLYQITMKDLNRLRVFFVEQRKTGKWLAEQLDVSTTTVSRWSSNDSQPDIQTLNKIAKVLNVNLKDLLINNEEELFSFRKSLTQYLIYNA